jgi:Urocanase Rossmann-like domain
MPDLSTTDPVLFAELAATYGLYTGLTRVDSTLGGKLLYAGELTSESARLIRAANVAGAASLTVTADPAMQRATIREAIADFLVTDLDEALRILKNEVRKRQTVAVCISASPEVIETEMLERGVLPDLRAPIAARDLPGEKIFLAVTEPAADFEARALALIPESDETTRRWLRLSPRYLGPRARRVRSLACTKKIAAMLTADH